MMILPLQCLQQATLWFRLNYQPKYRRNIGSARPLLILATRPPTASSRGTSTSGQLKSLKTNTAMNGGGWYRLSCHSDTRESPRFQTPHTRYRVLLVSPPASCRSPTAAYASNLCNTRYHESFEARTGFFVVVSPMQPHRRQVMVVEDDAPLREILQVLLQDYPHDFVFAENGRHALELDAIHEPELIMVDLGLPDMSGLELGRELRRRRGSSRRLIAFTGYDSDDYRQQARDAGFDDFYLKPMELDAMERTFAKIFAEPV